MNWKTLSLMATILLLGSTAAVSADDLFRHKAKFPPVVQPVPIYRPTHRYPWTRPMSTRELERHIEYTIKRQLGHCVDDVDVDLDARRRRVSIEAEVRHPGDRIRLQQLVYSLPELIGYQICLEVELDR